MLSFHNPSDDPDSQDSSVLSTIGAGDNPQVSPQVTPPSSPLTGSDPPLTWHTLKSFIPIFELLGPKFVLDQNAYYIHGLVDDNDLAILRDHSSLVTEFILTDDNFKPSIAPATFFHMAQLLGPNSAFLPSLLRLRIVNADTYLAYLHLLLTPSLTTLEATNVPDHQHPTFFSFLTMLIHKVPLENIVLGPGRFPLKSLQAILKFTHLRELELRDAVSTIDFTFFQNVGTLPNLESFVLDARSCEYISLVPPKTPPTGHTDLESQTPKQKSPQTPPWAESNIDNNGPPKDAEEDHHKEGQVGSQSPKSLSDTNDDDPSEVVFSHSSRPSSPTPTAHEDDKDVDYPLQPITEVPDEINSSASTVGGFYQLKRFHFVGRLPLIQDIIPHIASSTLEDISITVIRLSLQELKIEYENMTQAEAEDRRRQIEEETQRRIRAITSSMRLRRMVISAEMKRQLEEEDINRAEKMQKHAQATFDLHTASYISVLQIVSSRQPMVLKMVKFNQLGSSSQSLSEPPALPKQVYGNLICHPKLEILELRGWKLQDFLFSLKPSSLKNLKQFHLPIDDPDSSLPLSGLRDIAEACPMLESLLCCIDTLAPIPKYSIPTSKALSHGLQTLVVANNPPPSWDFNQLLLVARHLYLLFPYLQTVEGPNATEHWVHIRDLVKMFQTIREDDTYRF